MVICLKTYRIAMNIFDLFTFRRQITEKNFIENLKMKRKEKSGKG